ncbi:MAG TPA: hypothetical protein VIT64_00610 [Ilumatobacteraceae bacterium]
MFGRPVDEDAAPLEVELFHDVAESTEHDVDLGGGATRGTKSGRRWIFAAVGGLAVVLLGLVAFSFGRDNDAPIRADSTLARTTVVASTTAATVTTGSSEPRRSPSTTSELLAGAPLLPTDQPWSIYLLDQSGGQSMRIDVQTGVAERVDGRISFVVSPAGSFVVDMAEEGFGFNVGILPAGPEYGTYWQMGYNDANGGVYVSLRRQQFPRAEELTRIDLLSNEYLLGGTAAGEPVVTGADGDAYAITPEGRRRLATGLVTAVQNGYFSEISCTDEGICGQILHGAVEVRRAYYGSENVSFSPSGEWAAMSTLNEPSGDPPVQLLNLVNGSVVALGNGFVPGYFGFGSASLVAFTPDSRWAIGVSRSTLVVIELETGAVSRYALPGRSSSLFAAVAVI